MPSSLKHTDLPALMPLSHNLHHHATCNEDAMQHTRKATRRARKVMRREEANATCKKGDPTSEEANATCKKGDPTSEEGDTTSKEGDTTSKEGDATSKEGDATSKEGDATSEECDTTCEEGDARCRRGEEDACERGGSVSE